MSNVLRLEIDTGIGHQEVELDMDDDHDFDLASFLVQMGWKKKA